MGIKTKIDWCDSTWSPVTGCLRNCEYCYARKIANRFSMQILTGHDHLYICDEPVKRENGSVCPYPFGFDPTFHIRKLGEPQKWKQPKNIFVCSMADLFGDWVPTRWIADVFNACKAAPQHRYLFLTKNPKRYFELNRDGLLPNDDNLWYGTTLTTPIFPLFLSDIHNTFISFEPLLEEIVIERMDLSYFNWVIIGAETGNRKGKVIPEKKWITGIVNECNILETPVFMKESLRGIMGEDFLQEFPWEA